MIARGAQLAARLLVMKYRVCLEQDEDGVFVATCPALRRA